MSDFEKLYGPLNYSFEYNDNLFVFLSNINPENSDNDYIDYLNEVLSNRNIKIKHTFIFMHEPPAVMKHQAFHAPLNKDKLTDILQQYKVDYTICGDYHKHLEYIASINNNRYIMSGSGGAHYHGNTQWGRFKSATKITIDNNGIQEDILISANSFALTDNSIKHYLCNKLFQLQQNQFLFNTIIIIIVLNFMFSVPIFKKCPISKPLPLS